MKVAEVEVVFESSRGGGGLDYCTVPNASYLIQVPLIDYCFRETRLLTRAKVAGGWVTF